MFIKFEYITQSVFAGNKAHIVLKDEVYMGRDPILQGNAFLLQNRNI